MMARPATPPTTPPTTAGVEVVLLPPVPVPDPAVEEGAALLLLEPLGF